MGTDADVHFGVLVHSRKISGMFAAAMTDSDVDSVRNGLLADENCCELLTAYQVYLPVFDPERSERKGHIHLGDACGLLRKVSSCHAFNHWMNILFDAVVGCETGNNAECWVKDDELVEQVVNIVAKVCEISLPSYELRAFGNARKTGLWDVEYGALYFNFGVDECFERVLTPAGRALAAQLGEDLEVSEWVSISY